MQPQKSEIFMPDGLIRLAVAIPRLHLASPGENLEELAKLMHEAEAHGASLTITPELSLTGATCGALFQDTTLLAKALDAAKSLTDSGAGMPFIAGLPLKRHNRILNTALVKSADGAYFVSKSNLSPSLLLADSSVFAPVPPGDSTDISPDCRTLLLAGGLCAMLLIGEMRDADVARAAANGANVILNICATPSISGNASRIRRQLKYLSEKYNLAIAYANAGIYESNAEAVFDGQAAIAANGIILAENSNFARNSHIIYADIKPEWFGSLSRSTASQQFTCIQLPELKSAPDMEYFHINPLPFVPQDKGELAQTCDEILDIQATALACRMERTFSRRLVIGISGGLDSTLALLACAKACDKLGIGHNAILAVTMPGMGTSGRTKSNATGLAIELGAELREISIRNAVSQHFQDIGHDADNTNVVYENAQARERTQILMDLANEVNGIVVGTGDLSETAMGWCTYNGDHISMYGINGDIPKSLMQKMVEHVAQQSPDKLAVLLRDVNSTPISPELLPGEQKTESIIGSYDIIDFYLFNFCKYHETPQNLLALACHAFKGKYERPQLETTLKTFFRRFVTQQFKRNTMPDGPKVGTISLNARSDWRMPSDASFKNWDI